MNFLDLIGGVVSGGVTGILGGALQMFATYKGKQLDMALEKQRGDNEVAKREIDHKIAQAEYAGKLAVAKEEGETAKEVAASVAFSKGLIAEPERYSSQSTLTAGQNWLFVIIDCLRGIVRPALTLYLCALTTYIWWQVRQLISKEDLVAADVLEVWRLVVQTILYLTTTCILWWFATRNTQSAPKI